MNDQLVGRKLRGLSDYDQCESIEFRRWVEVVQASYAAFGFVPLETRPFELLSTVAARGGMGKQIFGVYRIKDGRPTEFALPFDRTVPFAVWTAQHHGRLALPFRRSDVSLSFRGERPQAGRFLGFYQADVDIVGRGLDLTADSDCIAAVDHALARLGLPPYRLCLNHLDLARSMVRALGVPGEAVPDALRLIDKLDKVAPVDIVEGLRLLGATGDVEAFLGRVTYDGPIGGFHPGPIDAPGARALEELDVVASHLAALGVPDDRVTLTPARVRGLDYYSGVVFETLVFGFEGYGSIASGGRYDDLIGSFAESPSGVEIQGVGGSIGLTRLFDVACREGWINPSRQTLAEVLVGRRASEFTSTALKVATDLRARGIPTEIAHGLDVRNQLALADRKHIPFVVVVMSPSTWMVRDLVRGRQEDARSQAAVLDLIAAWRAESC